VGLLYLSSLCTGIASLTSFHFHAYPNLAFHVDPYPDPALNFYLIERHLFYFSNGAVFRIRIGTPTKRQVSKRPVSKRLKRQVYKMSGLQNVRFTKCQVYKTSGCKKTTIYILYLWLVVIRRFYCSHVRRQSDGCVLFSILEGFFAIYHHNC
jgi:hypothetical protein